MAQITNCSVDNLGRSIFRSGYPMMESIPSQATFLAEVERIEKDMWQIGTAVENPHIKRAIKLAQTKGGGHDQFLTGITVDFDLTFSLKAWVEMERYTFMNFISSQSTMHRILRMSIDECCNDFVEEPEKEKLRTLQLELRELNPVLNPKAYNKAFYNLIYNLPSGFEYTSGMTTNYRCLKNIYSQRRHHLLPDWHIFCDWIEGLPLANLFLLEGD